jgi:ubiquinol-cytochrome c reductase cytochrome b subunit
LGGVIALILRILILAILPFYNIRNFRGIQFYPINKILFWTIVVTVFLLTWIGARPVENPYILVGQILTVVYFLYYLINPLISNWWDKLIN